MIKLVIQRRVDLQGRIKSRSVEFKQRKKRATLSAGEMRRWRYYNAACASLKRARGTRVFALNVVCNQVARLWKLIEILSQTVAKLLDGEGERRKNQECQIKQHGMQWHLKMRKISSHLL